MSDYGALLLPFRKLGDQPRRLKIGVVVQGAEGPLWIRDLIEYLAGIEYFDVRVLMAGEESHEEPAGSKLAKRLYGASRRKYNLFAEVEIGQKQTAEPLDSAHELSSEDRAIIISGEFDVLFWPEGPLPSGRCTDLARFGVFSLGLGEEKTAPPYWREVIEQQPASATVLYWHEATFEKARAVYRGETSTQQDWAFTKNAEEPLTAAPRMFATMALELMRYGNEWIEGACGLPEVNARTGVERNFPSLVDAVRFIGHQASRSAAIRLRGRGKLRRWFIATRRNPALFYQNAGKFSRSGFEDIPLRGTHMADPFVVSDGRKQWLFFEYVPLGGRRGRLSCMELRGGIETSKPEIVLQTGYHLSYPCVFQHGGEYFMIPESSANKTIQLYRATRFPFEWKLEKVLLEGVSAVDTTPFHLDGRWYFFTTTTEPFMESFLFWSNSLDGEWQLHPLSPISSSVRNIRSAGHLFYRQGRLLRPTQDCSVRYGYGITMNEIKRLTPGEFEEQRVDWIGPNWRTGLLGTHTLNGNAEVEVIDGIRYQ